MSDGDPGIRRLRRGRGFSYRDAQGIPIRDAATLGRLRSLAIPPAWRDVWICPFPEGYLQATGRDARGRKQYRYHPAWRELRDQDKFSRLVAFGSVLPRIRRQVRRDLRLSALPREKVLAAIVRLLDLTAARIGNEEYRRTNDSFGLTTLRDRHVDIALSRLRLSFRGKSGMEQNFFVDDRRLARVVRRCQDLPGQRLFQYLDEAGEPNAVSSTDVNEYLRAAAGEDTTAKDFRTWHGTVHALAALRGRRAPRRAAQARASVVEVVDRVARRLGNTRAICRKYYIHPALIAAYLDGSLQQTVTPVYRRRPSYLSAVEVDLLVFLRQVGA